MSSIIPYDMDGGAYVPAYLDLMIEMESISGHPSVGAAFNPTHDAGTFFSQGQPLIDEGWINSRPFDIPRYTSNPDVDAETHPLQLHSHRDVVHPSYSVGKTMIDLTPSKSTSGGSEGFGPGSIISNEDLTFVDLDGMNATQDWPENEVSSYVSSEQGDQYALVDTTSNFLVPPTPPGVFSTVAQYQGQGAPRERPKQSRKTGKRTTTMSSPAPQRQARLRGARKGPYPCNICDKSYAQKQGVTRHHREKHEASVCLYCDTFKWGRPYLLREHHKKVHSNVDLNVALPAPGASPKRTTNSGYPRIQHVLLPTPEPDEWGPAESPLHPLTPLPALAKPGLKSPAEEHVQFAKDMDGSESSRHAQPWSEPESSRLIKADARLSTSQSNPFLVPVPTPTLAGRECRSSPVFALPAFRSPGHTSFRSPPPAIVRPRQAPLRPALAAA